MLQEGKIYVHEHITIDLSEQKNSEDCCLDAFEHTVEELKALRRAGVGNIVDVTNRGMGRNIGYVKRVAEQTGINILCSTGYYQEDFLPAEVLHMTVEELAGQMIREIRQGIKGTGVKAAVIGEIATSRGGWTAREKRVFEAAVIASLETGAPITTHTSRGTFGYEQAAFFRERGVAPERVIIGHSDLSGDVDQVLRILDLGVTVGFDTIGKISYLPDERRAQMLKVIEEHGYTGQVCLSMDITRKSHLKANGGPGYAYLLETFLPLARRCGVSEAFIEKMMVENPRRWLGRGEAV